MKKPHGSPFGGHFIMLAQRKGRQKRLEECREFAPCARVLFALIERAEYGNRVIETGSSLGRQLGLAASVVNRHLVWLEKEGFIVRDRTKSIIWLDEERFWKGDGGARRRAMRNSLKYRMKRAGMTGIVKGGKTANDRLDVI